MFKGSPNRRVILLTSTVSFISLMMYFSFTSILGGLKDELALSNAQFGLLLSAFSVAYAAAQIPAGILSDRYGGKIVSSVGLSLMAIAALAFSFSKDFGVALGLRCLIGLAGGLILPSAIRIISDWYAANERNLAMGIFGLGQGLGFILTYSLGSIVVVLFGWRAASLFSGIIGSVAAALAWIFLRDVTKHTSPKQPLRLTGEQGYLGKLILLIMMNFAAACVLSGTLQFTPQFLASRFNLSTIAGGFVVSLVGVTNMLASYFGGSSSRKVGAANVVITSMLMCTVLPMLLGNSYSATSAFVLVALIGFSTMFYVGPTFAGVPRAVGEKHAGTMFGVFNAVSFGLSALAPLIFGYILDNLHSYELAFTSLSIIATIGFVAAVQLKRMRFFTESA